MQRPSLNSQKFYHRDRLPGGMVAPILFLAFSLSASQEVRQKVEELFQELEQKILTIDYKVSQSE